MSPTPEWLTGRRIGYVPYKDDFSAPGDRRRIGYWAEARHVPLEVVREEDQYDLMVLSARADITSWARDRSDTPIVFDLIDSYLAHPSGVMDYVRGTGKWLLRQHAHLVPSYVNGLKAMCERADIVVCSTPEQQEMLRPYARDVRSILDIHAEVPATPGRLPEPSDGVLRLFWEGLPQNLYGFLPQFNDALAELASSMNVELHLVTDAEFDRWFGRVGRISTDRLAARLAVPPQIHQWSITNLVEVAASCDIGVIPLDLDYAMARSKPENKLAIMWRLGLPVVASATPAYRRVMAAAGSGFACSTTEQWLTSLEQFAGDPVTREAAARRGAEYVHLHHSPAALLKKWDEVVRDALRVQYPSV